MLVPAKTYTGMDFEWWERRDKIRIVYVIETVGGRANMKIHDNDKRNSVGRQEKCADDGRIHLGLRNQFQVLPNDHVCEHTSNTKTI